MAKGVYLHKPENYPPSRKGVKLTKEHRRKISDSLKGNTWNRGRKHSSESTLLKRQNASKHWQGRKGKQHPAWKEFKLTPLYQQIRNCVRYAEWRTKVYKRDDFTCVLCKRKKEVSGRLEADHFPKMFCDLFGEYNIKTYDDAMACDELWDTENGRTLCISCHNPTRGKRSKFPRLKEVVMQ